MTAQPVPFVETALSHSAELFRREALASLPFGSAGGVIPATAAPSANITAGTAGCSDLLVIAPASGMSVLVNPGQCYVPGSLGSGSGYGIGTGYGMPTVTLNGGSAPTVASNAKATSVQLTTQGIYYCYNDNSSGQVSLDIASANPSNPRIDVVVAQVEDAQYSGSNNDWKLAVVTGTAAASPTVPSLPANSLVLAYVWVPANATSISSGDLLDLRVACNRNPFRAAMYRSASWTSANGFGTLPMDTLYSDLTGACSIGSSQFTCPVTGLYFVGMRMSVTATAAGQNIFLQLNVNGSEKIRSARQYAYGAVNVATFIASLAWCNAGDLIVAGNYSSAALAGDAGLSLCYMQVALVSPV